VSSPRLIPLFDLRLTEEEIDAAAGALRSGWLTMGPRCQEFERLFAEHLGVRHAVTVSSCTAALHLAYLAAGVREGDEVIVPAITFVATAAAARYCGATPVLADVVGPHDLGVDPVDVAARITPRTKAVCAVHYGGYAADVEGLRDVCAAHGVALIEDAAHSPSAGVRDGGPKLGTYGLAGAFSFFSNKVLSCGEGGLLATDDDDVAALARSLRSHALTSTTWDRHRGHAAGYDVTGVGFNYRLDEPRAALLIERMKGLEDDIAARRRIVHRYRALLEDVPGVTVPYADDAVDRSSCYVMPVILEEPSVRPELQSLLLERHGVQTSVLYAALQGLSAYSDLDGGGLARSDYVARAELTLPLYPHLSEQDQETVVAALRQELTRLGAG
jgi:dTDP-4-amino-4,6-dideoxygalactose transaminase